ncbi:disintegrin and metalloproteinase domain-containing protein 10-like [Pecten maximus]|uniref:disintegrin and metalloproteinase domain-containing protein 10-like n=1 Tax=Pecten maximus TaxID=6579 RepID=UPI0014581BB6|nr:disintegrin and metalloproteinase domain-containing protein 10-like [Pecten maximus]
MFSRKLCYNLITITTIINYMPIMVNCDSAFLTKQTNLSENERKNGTADENIRAYVSEYKTVLLNVSDRFASSVRQEHSYADKIVHFNAYGKDFTLVLQLDRSLLSPDLNVTMGKSTWSGSQLSTMDLSSVFSGSVLGEKSSFVYGKIDRGTFDGIIQTKDGIFYLEPLSKYSPDGMDDSRVSIVYRKVDLMDKKSPDNFKQKEHCRAANSSDIQQPMFLTNVRNKHSRAKRAAIFSYSCTLHIVVDHTFFSRIGQSSRSQTIAEILYLVGSADHIFRSTDFDGDGKGDNVGFIVAAITIHTNETADDYKMSDSTDVYAYLNQFSKYNFNDYCLGIAFTSRDFEDGVVGLAWVGNSDVYGPPGGICQTRLSLSGELFNLNTALVSLFNYGSRIPSYRAALTVAHEFGHSFGSAHDDVTDVSCSPGNEIGNFIMFPYAADGSKPNNNMFSSCSLSQIYPVIVNKGECLRREIGSVCGNGIVEVGEECDCGSSRLCEFYDDMCCVPSDVTHEVDRPCNFRRQQGKVCSWTLSPCCSKNCTYIPATDNHECAEATRCKQESVCDGTSGECPDGSFSLDGIPCDGGKKVCEKGLCTKSICESQGMDTCQCTGTEENMCMLCCSDNATKCQPAKNFEIIGVSDEILYRDAGESCYNNAGICDKKHQCIRNYPNDVIKRLGKIFNDDNLEDMKTWLKKYWYYIVIALIGIAILIFISILTKKKLDNTHIDAYRMGRLMRVTEQANLEKERQKRQFKEFEEKYNEKIQNAREGAIQREFTEAVSRLVNLFPTAKTETIAEVCRKSTSEDVAVRILLVKGYPIRRIVTS